MLVDLANDHTCTYSTFTELDISFTSYDYIKKMHCWWICFLYEFAPTSSPAVCRQLVFVQKFEYWLIVIKFYSKVPNRKKKLGIDFGGYGLNLFVIKGQKGVFNNHFIVYITQVSLLLHKSKPLKEGWC